MCPPPRSTLFPYTTLFRSRDNPAAASRHERVAAERSGAVPVPALILRRRMHCRTPSQPATNGRRAGRRAHRDRRSEEHTSELQSQSNLVCRLLLEKKNINNRRRDQWASKYKPRVAPHDPDYARQPSMREGCTAHISTAATLVATTATSRTWAGRTR